MAHEQERLGNPGLIAGLLGIARNFLGLMINRIELAALEFSGIGRNLVRFLVLFALAAISLWFALAFWIALVVFLAWESWGWKIFVAFGVFFTALTALIILYARPILRQGCLSLPATMTELRKDRDALL